MNAKTSLIGTLVGLGPVLMFVLLVASAIVCAQQLPNNGVPPGQPAQTAATQTGNGDASSAPAGSRSPLRGWVPPDVDEAAPPVAVGVSCSLPEVLQGAAKRVQELVANLEQFSATERIEHRELDKKGKVRESQARAFDYLVSLREIRPGILAVEETRNAGLPLNWFPGRLASTGLAALALIFHPYYVEDFQMACEGLGQWRSQPAWQVRFQQRRDRPVRIRGYKLPNGRYLIKLKGRAWIAADSHQVLRLETDLLEPLPEIRLEGEHLVIEYRPVQFHKRGVELWLPESADMYVHFRGRRSHRRHTFSDFVLFWVDVRQEIYDPRQPG